MLSSLSWIPKGVAKHIPEQAEIDEEELKAFKDEAENAIASDDSDSEPSSSEENSDVSDMEEDIQHAEKVAKALKGAKGKVTERTTDNGIVDAMAELEMDKYDDDSEDEQDSDTVQRILGAGNPGLAYYKDPSADPYLTKNKTKKGKKDDSSDDESDGDSEDDELHLKDTDLLILTARNEDDVSHLEVWVYEQPDDRGPGNVFVHHAIMLPAFPLSTTWLNCGKDGAQGNFAAVASFEPGIEIWDLDVLDTVEPVLTLGGADYDAAREIAASRKTSTVGKKKKGGGGKKGSKKGAVAAVPEVPVKPGSHCDAVLGLAWNKEFRNVLASASADKTVKIWDISTATCSSTLTHHKDKVQAVAWCPSEASVLLSGGFDGLACLVDMRVGAAAKPAKWKLPSDVECVSWDTHNPTRFAVSCDNGEVLCFDARSGPTGDALFRLGAHEKAATALAFCPGAPNLMLTASTDKMVKIWGLEGGGGGKKGGDGGGVCKPKLLASQDLKVGSIFTAAFCGDAPFTVAAGGSQGDVAVWDTMVADNVAEWVGK
jgi:periodic tryptophan protein 1